MAQAKEQPTSRWPPLPEGCPPDDATRQNREFFRFTDSADQYDWTVYVEKFGIERFAARGSDAVCRAHGLSIYPTLQSAQAAKRLVPRLRNHRIIRFRVLPYMGVAIETQPKTHHYCWWPDSTFQPPPADAELVG
jgi:hypothetical protein